MPLWDKDRQTEGEGDRATERKGGGGVGISVPLLQIIDFMSGRGGTVREKYGAGGLGLSLWASMMLNEDYGVEYQDEETRNEFWLLIIAALLLGICFANTQTLRLGGGLHFAATTEIKDRSATH
ncbi:hypothetical protein ACFX11_028423 [Malus domestica]